MKNYKYIYVISLLFLLACQEDILEKEPLDIISDGAVWEDETLIDAYLTQCYAEVSVFTNETPGYTNAWDGDWTNSELLAGPFFINGIADEAMAAWGAYTKGQIQAVKAGGLTINGGFLEWYETPYNTNRSLNKFIIEVSNSALDDSFKKVRIAEARFLRAFNYFSMVKRYGGIPLITEPREINAPEEQLYPTRNSEKEIYDFVISEIDDIARDLPEVASDFGRATKFAALALKSRAALYAASIAQFGTVQLDGLLGIPLDQADVYYNKAYEASKEIVNSDLFELYNVDADKVQNFKNIFLVKRNKEVIFAKQHNEVNGLNGGNSWNYDFFQCPKPQAWNGGNNDGPYLEMVEEFEYVDGTSGKLDWENFEDGLWSMEELWGNKDPRFFATIYTQDTPWKGGFVDYHNGLILPDGSVLTDGDYNGVLALGSQGVPGRQFYTGFGVMKYLDETANNNDWVANSKTDYIVFRYAEILLNLAEAAYELNKPNEALDAINQIRSRAGIASISDIDREKIRHERKVELAFEGHRYWDLRRWRIAASVLSDNFSGLRYILDYETRKYRLQVIPNIDGEVTAPQFNEHNYYFPITLARTGKNQNLVENPGYN